MVTRRGSPRPFEDAARGGSGGVTLTRDELALAQTYVADEEARVMRAKMRRDSRPKNVLGVSGGDADGDGGADGEVGALTHLMRRPTAARNRETASVLLAQARRAAGGGPVAGDGRPPSPAADELPASSSAADVDDGVGGGPGGRGERSALSDGALQLAGEFVADETARVLRAQARRAEERRAAEQEAVAERSRMIRTVSRV